MSGHRFTIYCDKLEDIDFARRVFTDGPLGEADLRLLPPRTYAPEYLQAYVSWERADWIIVRDETIVAIAEITEHGYTGDNGFQRFARPQRAAMLGIPFVYFTPFSRTRLNEMEEGRFNARNVAPEMFRALLQAGKRYDVPCLAMRWPTDSNGQPLLLRSDNPHVVELKAVLEGFAVRPLSDPGWTAVPRPVVDAMEAQASIVFRTSETRLVVDLPVDVESDNWIWDMLPPAYFRRGKAEKVFAHAALAGARKRRLPAHAPTHGFWSKPGRAQVLYIGYQWRPDPTTGLIAFSGALADAAGLPLIVVWPRVFLNDGRARQKLLTSWDELRSGQGCLADCARTLGYSEDAIARLGERAQIRDRQFGVFAPTSKVGRVMAEVVDLAVFGDALYLPK